jgi:DNA polymerase-3 subunit alpha
VGEQAVAAIAREREAQGPFRDIFDLCERVDPKQLPKGNLDILIKAGALDALGPERAQHLALSERAIQNAASKLRDKQAGQKNLFGGEEQVEAAKGTAVTLPDVPPLTHRQKLADEKEVFGFYLTSHPLTEHSSKLQLYSTHTSADLATLGDGTEVRLGGMISAIKRTNTKKPSRNGHTKYANFDFEDVRGTVRCIMWPEDYARLGEHVKPEAICLIEGRVDRRGREPNVVVNSLITLEEASRKFTDQVAVKFQRGLHGVGEIDRVGEILRRHPGRCDVLVVIDSFDDHNPTLRFRHLLQPSAAFKVAADAELATELEEVVGPGNVRYVSTQKHKPGGNGNGKSRSNGGGY